MFDALSDKLQGVFRSLRGQGSLTEADVDAALREIRLALLEADVHFKVVKQFLERVRVRATGQEVLKSLTPAQAVIRDRARRDGGAARRRRAAAPADLVAACPPSSSWPACRARARPPPRPSSAAGWPRRGHHPLLVSTDVYRPAAREQLRTLGDAGRPEGPPPRGPRRAARRSCARPSPRRAPWATTSLHRRHRRPPAHRRRADGRAAAS